MDGDVRTPFCPDRNLFGPLPDFTSNPNDLFSGLVCQIATLLLAAVLRYDTTGLQFSQWYSNDKTQMLLLLLYRDYSVPQILLSFFFDFLLFRKSFRSLSSFKFPISHGFLLIIFILTLYFQKSSLIPACDSHLSSLSWLWMYLDFYISSFIPMKFEGGGIIAYQIS